jgi:hypothetical protein
MDRTPLQTREYPEMRTIRICLDQPQSRATILGIVRRIAADQAAAGRTDRHVPTHR